MPHQPPSRAGPRTASVLPSVSIATAVDTWCASSWGVSMPTRNAGPRKCAKTFASRSARPAPTCGTTANSGGSHGPVGPSSAMMCRRAGTAASVSRVSASAASARTAASSCVHGGHSRVLTRPGSGDLAMTIKVTPCLIAALSSCLGRHERCLARCRSPLIVRCEARSSPRPRRCASRPAMRAGPFRVANRTGDPRYPVRAGRVVASRASGRGR